MVELWGIMMNKFKELLFLKNIKGLGNSKINKNYVDLLDEYEDLDDLITEIEYRFKIPLTNLETARKKAEVIYDKVIDHSDISIITLFDDNYPEKLLDMGDKKPLILYAKGNIEVLSKPNIAFIGTRKPSKMAEEFEENIVKAILDSTDRVIVSGLALGCDKIAHQTTVDENKITVAVLPSGLNVITPVKHKKLSEEIIQNGGCLISEYNLDKKPYKQEFLERDKIIAALSDATFVVECGVKSGTMHTVDAAAEYNRKIFTYLPEDIPKNSFDGNQHILKNKPNSIKVEDIGAFLKELSDLDVKEVKSTQPTLFDFN